VRQGGPWAHRDNQGALEGGVEPGTPDNSAQGKKGYAAEGPEKVAFKRKERTTEPR
jgi:hypothetical protein